MLVNYILTTSQYIYKSLRLLSTKKGGCFVMEKCIRLKGGLSSLSNNVLPVLHEEMSNDAFHPIGRLNGAKKFLTNH